MDSLQRIWLRCWDGVVARLGRGRIAQAVLTPVWKARAEEKFAEQLGVEAVELDVRG